MKLKITITMDCTNDAFIGDWSDEAMRIINDGTLNWIVRTMYDAANTSTTEVDVHMGRIIKDYNGNTVGRIDGSAEA